VAPPCGVIARQVGASPATVLRDLRRSLDWASDQHDREDIRETRERSAGQPPNRLSGRHGAGLTLTRYEPDALAGPAGCGHNCLVSNVRRFGVALLAVLGVVVAGSIGYVVLGYSLRPLP
jgi:hypothetical protein